MDYQLLVTIAGSFGAAFGGAWYAHKLAKNKEVDEKRKRSIYLLEILVNEICSCIDRIAIIIETYENEGKIKNVVAPTEFWNATKHLLAESLDNTTTLNKLRRIYQNIDMINQQTKEKEWVMQIGYSKEYINKIVRDYCDVVLENNISVNSDCNEKVSKERFPIKLKQKISKVE